MKTTILRRWRACALALVAAALVACANQEPRRTLVTLPTLAPPPVAPPAAGAADGDLASRWLAVRRVGLPEYLQARRVRYRADATTIAEWPHAFWAERLEVAASREFTAALAAALPGWRVCEGGCAARAPDAVLLVELSPLDFRGAQSRLEGTARMTVTSGDTARVLLAWQEALQIAAPRGGPQGQAEALGHALQHLAATAARRVSSLPRN